MNDSTRRYPERPILGVGAIIDDGARVVLVERGREPMKGVWSVPGGVVEAGETLSEAVRREALEETGLEVQPLSLAEVFERVLRDAEGRPEYHYVILDYLCRPAGGELRPGSDVTRARWVPYADLPSYRITEGTLDVIERAIHAR